MREQEVRNLWEAYLEVCENQQLDEVSDELVGRAVNKRIAASGAANDAEMRDRTPENMRASVRAGEKEASMKTAAAKRRKRINNEETDLFDAILEHLVSEGYADTNESALVIMANMSEEWRRSIVEGGLPNFGISPSSTTGTAQGDFELGGGITKMKRDNMNRDQVIKQGRKNIDNQSGYTWGHQGPGTPQSNQRKDMYKKQGVTFPEDK